MLTIGIIWLPNAGKSTLFNTLVGSHRAIVTDVAGTTRDIISESFDYDGYKIKIMDTPGLSDKKTEKDMIQYIINKSDYCFFVIDGHQDITPAEQDIVDMIIKSNKHYHTFLLVNKMEKYIDMSQEFEHLSQYYTLGFEHVIAISAKYRNNLDLVWDIIHHLPKSSHNSNIVYTKSKTAQEDSDSDGSIKIALLGKPNSGKSTLINTLCHQSLSHVSDIPGTTLDYITGHFAYKDQSFTVYDTAWLRRKSIVRWLESIANTKTFAMLKYIRPIVVILIDGTETVTRQDLVILSQVSNIGLSVVILINKVDLIDDMEAIKKQIWDTQKVYGYVSHIPILPISAKTGYGLANFYKQLIQIHQCSTIEISTSKLNTTVSKAFLLSPPKFPKNKVCKCKYITQISQNPIVFKVFVNSIDRVNFAFRRWLENVIRKEFNLTGLSLRFDFVANPDKSPRSKNENKT